jgi:TP901 family phage tail tape measure protein
MALPVSGIQLTAKNADIFIRHMAAAESAVERFRKSASRPTPFTQPDTRNAVAAFNDLVAKSQAAGQKAGAGMATGFEAGLSPIQTIVQGALLKTGALAVDAAIGLFTKAGQAASSAFNDALEFDLAVDSIAALTPAGEAAGAGIAAAIGGIATDANLVGSVDSATAAFYALSQGGIAVEDSIAGTLRSTILLQNSVGSLPGDLYETRDAAEVVAQGVQIFGLQAEETGGFVDALAAIAVNGRANLSDLNYVLANSASSVQSLGISYNDLAAATIASSASFSSSRTQLTAFDSFLSGLSAPTDKMKEALGLLGISAYDAKGDFVGLISLQGQLKAAFESGQYTTQAFQQLLTEGFGSVGRDFAVAIAKGEDFTTVLQGIEATSSEAIAAIKVDNAATALTNLGDIAQDLGRRLLQPFTEALTPAIQSLSSLLSSLAGYFDMVGQRIAASLSPILTYVTAQINGLSGAISALTGISVPTLGAGAAPGAAPAYGPQPAPSSTFASGSAGTDARQQERIGVAQLDSAKVSDRRG